QRQDVRDDGFAIFARDGENEPRLDERKFEAVRAVAGVADRAKAVFFYEVEDRDGAFVFDIGRRAADRVVEFDVDQARALRVGSVHRLHRGHRLSLMATERPCASSPSAFASAMAAGPSVRNCSGPSFRTDVRLTKS